MLFRYPDTMPEQETIRRVIESCRKEVICEADVRYDEPMRAHTTFKVGGPADCWVKPRGEGFPAFAAVLLSRARACGIPVFVLGGGANLVAADSGLRGIVLDTSGWTGVCLPSNGGGQTRICFRSGMTMDDAACAAAAAGLSGLEFLAGMPGSIGGAVWMNARCYGREIADALTETEVMYLSGEAAFTPQRVPADKKEFGYKRSPFQSRPCLILQAAFCLAPGDESAIRREMEVNRRDRESKGHYRYPCAGSVFKNNRDFGKPVGKIIDELGLRGLQKGGAMIAPFHGNIIINAGGATAADIRALADEAAARVKAATGFVLEPEILFAGDF